MLMCIFVLLFSVFIDFMMVLVEWFENMFFILKVIKVVFFGVGIVEIVR